MKIYAQEIEDGLHDLIKNNSIAYCSQPKFVEAEKTITSSDVIDKIYAQNKDQIDLYYLESVLVSTGWNKNDDVFDPQETWAAKDTPEDKQFNFMHNENDIIGHITGSWVVNRDGGRISSDSEVQKDFDIITQAVLYTSWSDQQNRDRMNKIIAEIEQGQWYVSMECLFPSFDYALIGENKETKIIERNEASAFLTKHLRAYGGEGIYENYKVGRLLRNLAFSGKGLVSKPANPRSIILDRNMHFDESESKILTVSSIKEKSMSDNLEKRVAELQAELDQAKSENKQLTEKVIAEKAVEYQSKIEDLESVIAEKTESFKELSEANKSLTEANTTLQETCEAMKDDMEKKDEEVKKMKKKEAQMKRKAQLQDIGLNEEEAAATVDSFDSIDDSAFDAIVDVMRNKIVSRETVTEPVAEAESSEEVDSAEAGEEALENVEPEAVASITEVQPEIDESESLRSAASEWIGSVLQSVPKK